LRESSDTEAPHTTQGYDRRDPEDFRHHLEQLDIPGPEDLEALATQLGPVEGHK